MNNQPVHESNGSIRTCLLFLAVLCCTWNSSDAQNDCGATQNIIGSTQFGSQSQVICERDIYFNVGVSNTVPSQKYVFYKEMNNTKTVLKGPTDGSGGSISVLYARATPEDYQATYYIETYNPACPDKVLRIPVKDNIEYWGIDSLAIIKQGSGEVTFSWTNYRLENKFKISASPPTNEDLYGSGVPDFFDAQDSVITASTTTDTWEQFIPGTTYYITLGSTFDNGNNDEIIKCPRIISFTACSGQAPQPGSITPTTANICLGSSQILTTNGGTGYQWYRNAEKMEGAITPTFTVTESGIYHADVVSLEGCTAKTSNTVAVKANEASIRPLTSSFCAGRSSLLTASGGTTYQWYKDGFALSGATGTTYNATAEGKYTALVTDNGCTPPQTYTAALYTAEVKLTNKPTPPSLFTTFYGCPLAEGKYVQFDNSEADQQYTLYYIHQGEKKIVKGPVEGTNALMGFALPNIAADQTEPTYFIEVTKEGCSLNESVEVPVQNHVEQPGFSKDIVVTGGGSVCSNGGTKTIHINFEPREDYKVVLVRDGKEVEEEYEYNNYDYSDGTQFFVNTPGTYSIRIEKFPQDFGGATICSQTFGNVVITLSTSCVTFSGNALLQGAYNTAEGQMNNTLNTSGLLSGHATSQPFNTSGYGYTGHEAVPSYFFYDNQGVVDWVLLELRDATTPTKIVSRRAAFVLQDGTIVENEKVYSYDYPYGNYNSTITFPDVAPGNYYVAVRHRNHLGVMTATALPFASNNTPTVDFTAAETPTYGTAARKNEGGRMLLWAGDANGDGRIRYNGQANDKNAVLSKVGLSTPNNVLSLYDPTDVNMDGKVRYNGSANDKNVVLRIVGLLTPNQVITEQLPHQ